MSRVEVYRKKSLPTKWIIAGLLLAVMMVISSILLLLYPFASKDKTPYFKGENPILFQNEQYGNALLEGDTVFIPVKFVKEHLDEALFYDEKSESVIITTENKVIQMPTDSLTYYVNEKPVTLHLPGIKNSNGELFISIDPLLSYYPFQYEILKDTNAIWIHRDGEKLALGSVKSEEVHEELLRLRTQPSLKSPYTTSVKSGEAIFIEKETSEHLYVRKNNGEAGYLQKEFVKEGEIKQVQVIQEEHISKVKPIEGPVRLTWEAVYNRNPNTAQLPDMPGINVVSPTWFELENAEGAIKNLGSLDYMKWAESKGYQVWGLFSNAFDPELTHLAFKDYETRQKMIRQLLHYSQIYRLQGINLDIENVNVEDGPFITQFVREATPLFHEAGLTVSMDITFISTSGNWSMFYEREKLGKLVDYLMVMAYDEHWGSSPVAGSVSSLPWVESNLTKLLEVVQHEKLILGVPLYTRLWKEQTLADGKVEVTPKALSMAKIKEWLEKHQLKPIYDAETGQNFAEIYVKEENATYKVWLEDELSLKKRAELVEKYSLAGVASWSRFFADETAWTALHSDTQNLTNANKK